ncbi:hypothetical protein AgCh_001673 [Apium graveolens]
MNLYVNTVDNILLSENKKIVKITDFGLSREEIIGDMSTEAGTYRWKAPEVAGERNKKRYDHKVDVYSFLLVLWLWELLTNTTPFKGKCGMTAAYAAVTQNARPSTDNIPKEIVSLLVSCWAETLQIGQNLSKSNASLRTSYTICGHQILHRRE